MFSLICVWINDWVNNHEAGDLIRHRGHYDVNIMSQRIIKYVPISRQHHSTSSGDPDDATTSKWCPHYLRFVRGIRRSPVDSLCSSKRSIDDWVAVGLNNLLNKELSCRRLERPQWKCYIFIPVSPPGHKISLSVLVRCLVNNWADRECEQMRVTCLYAIGMRLKTHSYLPRYHFRMWR